MTHALGAWICDTPLSSGWSEENDALIAEMYDAFMRLRFGKRMSPRLRAEALRAARIGLRGRVGYPLTDDERLVLDTLTRIAVADTRQRADPHGVKGLRCCSACYVVFGAQRRTVCESCRGRKPREYPRRRLVAKLWRAAHTLAENRLTDDPAKVEKMICALCGSSYLPWQQHSQRHEIEDYKDAPSGPFLVYPDQYKPARSDLKYCSQKCDKAAWRARKAA